MSLLSWERGLKLLYNAIKYYNIVVAPLVGAWIEMTILFVPQSVHMSLLSWERGLKYVEPPKTKQSYSRSSRGSVD